MLLGVERLIILNWFQFSAEKIGVPYRQIASIPIYLQQLIVITYWRIDGPVKTHIQYTFDHNHLLYIHLSFELSCVDIVLDLASSSQDIIYML